MPQSPWYYRFLPRNWNFAIMRGTPALRLLVFCFLFVILCGALLFAAFRITTTAAAGRPAAISVPHPAIPSPAPIATPTSTYTVKRGQDLAAVARENLSHTSYMTVAELEAAIGDANHLHPSAARLQPGQQLVIPGYLEAPIVEHAVPAAKDYAVRAIYLTGLMAGSAHGINLIRRWHELGGNSVVFDIKDSDGSLSIGFDDPLAPHTHHPYISSLPKFVHFLHGMNMHAIARMALFRDEHLVVTHPELAVQSRRALAAAAGKGPQPWRENGKLVWTDPSNPAVQDYELALAKYVASLGVDEIQFDYVRFPAEGDQADAQFAFMKAAAACKDSTAQENCSAPHTRADVIAGFLQRAYKELHPSGVLLSLDVFGVMAWQRPVDLNHTGQDIVRMARNCDVLSPMIYPSHFFGMDGYALPGDAPEHFISESMQRFEQITQGSGVVIRPWLQAFAWRTKTYSPAYIETQVRVARANGGDGFLFWNARNDYSKPFAAMPAMTAAAAEYFQMPPKTASAATMSRNESAASLGSGVEH
jgi:hypothetical protein